MRRPRAPHGTLTAARTDMNNSDLPIRLGILIATHTATWVEESQPVQWRPDPWRRHWRLNGLPFSHVLDELEAEYSSHGTIRRKFILDAYQDRPATELFVATMAWVATTVPIGTTKTAPCGPTWRHRDGSMWPRFKRHREERARSVAGPSQADIPSPTVGVVPLQSVMVGPAQAVLTSMGCPVSGKSVLSHLNRPIRARVSIKAVRCCGRVGRSQLPVTWPAPRGLARPG